MSGPSAEERFKEKLQELRDNTCEVFYFGVNEKVICDENESELAILAEAIRQNTSLITMDFAASCCSDKAIEALAPALQTHPRLRRIIIQGNITDRGVSILAEALCGHPTIEQIKVEYEDTLQPATYYKLSQIIKGAPHLTELDVGFSLFTDSATQEARRAAHIEGEAILQNIIEQGYGKNLIKCLYVTDDVKLAGLINLLKSIPEETAQASPLSLYKAAQNMPGLRFACTQSYYPSMEEIEDLVQGLAYPEAATVEALTVPNSDGITALDNPDFWNNFKTHTERFTQSGASVSKAQIMCPNLEGQHSFIEGIRSRATSSVLAYLNAQGEYLTPEDLLDGKEPNALLNAIIEHDDVNNLFTLDNWRGQGANAMLRVYRALPEPAKEHVPGIHELTARLSRSPIAKVGISS